MSDRSQPVQLDSVPISLRLPPSVPFAAPFRAVDRLQVVRRDDGALELRASKLIRGDDPYVRGHYPGFLVYPGAFVVEGLVQAAALALGLPDVRPPQVTLVRKLRFTAPLLDGDTLSWTATVRPLGGRSYDAVARFRRSDGSAAARVELEMRVGGQADA